MEDRQWDAIAFLLDECWKGEFTDEKAEGYRVMLDRYGADEVLQALHRVAQNGSPWLPAVPEIIRAIERPAPVAPTWAEAWDTLTRAIVHFGYEGGERALPALGRRHPLYEVYARRHGWKRLCLEEVNDPEHGGAVLHRLEREWDALVAQESELDQALAAVGAPRRAELRAPSWQAAVHALPERRALTAGAEDTVAEPDQGDER